METAIEHACPIIPALRDGGARCTARCNRLSICSGAAMYRLRHLVPV